jgi:hypothetical protein
VGGDRRWIGSAACAAALVTCAATLAATAPAAPAHAAPQSPYTRARAPGLLASHQLRELVAAQQQGRSTPPGLTVSDGAVLVEALANGSIADTEDAVREVGGLVRASATELVLAEVPIVALGRLEADPSVGVLRRPLTVSDPIGGARATSGGTRALTTPAPVGEEVQKTNAAAWHDAGITGAGVRVGIIDGFDRSAWDALQSAGQLPAPAGTFCRWNGTAEDMWSGCWDPHPHGNGVAEIVHEMAPDAQLYLAEVLTTTDLAAAIDWFAANGVEVISRSETSEYDGPGTGTGPLAAEISRAVDLGMTWVNAAGNASGSRFNPVHGGGYWRGSYQDADGDGWVELRRYDGTYPTSTPNPSAPDTAELLPVLCPPWGVFVNGLRWSDWGHGASTSDYDTLTFDTPTPAHWSAAIHVSDNFQGDSHPNNSPIEYPQVGACATSKWRYIAIAVWDLNGGGTNDTFELLVNGSVIGDDYWSNLRSAAAPGVDLARAGHLGVGAIGDDPFGTDVASYSSWGPTNDHRIKPDLSAATCVQSSSFDPCFNGTSAAAPAVAGAAALVLDAGLAASGDELGTWLRTNATVDRATPGPDNYTGVGELVLPSPPALTPANDDFADAEGLDGQAGSTSGANVNATAEPDEPAHAGSPAAHSVWYRWTAPATGSLDVDTVGSDFATRLALYTGGSLPALAPVAAGDDTIAGVEVTQGTEYRLAVDGGPATSGYASGAVTLNWSLAPHTAPGAPTDISATAGSGDATVSWSPPASDGGSPLTSYRVTPRVDGAPVGSPTTVSGTTTSVTVSDLDNGTSYTFTVAAANAIGTGPESAPSAPVTPQRVDVQSPSVSLLAPSSTYTLSRKVQGSWDGDDDVALLGFDPDLRVTRWNGDPGTWLEWKDLDPATSASYWGTYGRTFCVRVEAHDTSANVSPPAQGCTAVPLHSGNLAYSGTWARYATPSVFAGAARATSSHGAAAVRTGVVGERLAVVATRCPSCGAIEVRLNGHAVKRFSLYAPTTKRSEILEFFQRAWPFRGTVSIHVISTNRMVIVEGLGVYQE